eukprot:gene111-163_t
MFRPSADRIHPDFCSADHLGSDISLRKHDQLPNRPVPTDDISLVFDELDNIYDDEMSNSLYNCYEDPSSFPKCGITMQLLLKIKSIILTKNPTWNMFDVCENLIKPWTNISKCSYTQLLFVHHQNEPSTDTGLIFHECITNHAAIYVSYSWKYQFIDLIDNLELFIANDRKKNNSNTTTTSHNNQIKEYSFWIDIFNLNQWKIPELSYEHYSFSKNFRNLMTDIGHLRTYVFHMIQQWIFSSSTPLLYQAELLRQQRKYQESRKLLDSVLRQRKFVLHDLHPDVLLVVHTLAVLLFEEDQVQEEEEEEEHSQCQRQSQCQRKSEGQEVEDSHSYSYSQYKHSSRSNNSNSQEQNQIQQHRQYQSREHRRYVLLEEARTCAIQAYKGREISLGSDHSDTLTSLHLIISILRTQVGCLHNNNDYSINILLRLPLLLLERVVQIQTDVLGVDHIDTLVSMHELGTLLREFITQSMIETRTDKGIWTETEMGNGTISGMGTGSGTGTMSGTISGIRSYDEILSLCEYVYYTREKVLGMNHRDTLESLNNLIMVLLLQHHHDRQPQQQQSGVDLEQILHLCERCLTSYQFIFDTEEIPTVQAAAAAAAAVVVVVVTVEQQEEVVVAVMEVEAREESDHLPPLLPLSSCHPKTLLAMRNLACVLHYMGNFERSRILYQHAIDGYIKIYNIEHYDTVCTMEELARVYESEGNLEETLSIYRKILQLRQSILGPEHIETLKPMDNICNILIKQGKIEVAIPLCKTILSISQTKIFGPDHPTTLIYMHTLGTLLKIHGDLHLAQETLERAFRGRELALGPSHIVTLISLHDLAVVIQLEGVDLDTAQRYFERVVTARERILGSHHRDTLLSMNHLATIYKLQCRYNSAQELLERILCINEELFGSIHENTIDSLHSLGDLLQCNGHKKTLCSLYFQWFNKVNSLLGLNHLITAHIAMKLAEAYESQNMLSKARYYYSHAYTGFESCVTTTILSPDDVNLVLTREKMKLKPMRPITAFPSKVTAVTTTG